MRKRRVVFDLDGTLLTGDFSLESEYFCDVFREKADILNEKIGGYLDEYERIYPKYDETLLSRFLSNKSGLIVTPNIIRGWIDIMKYVSDTMEDGVMNTLEFLKKENISLAVLTNWFGDTQLHRLKRAGILEYFDHVYTGEFVLKPHKNAYLSARDRFSSQECLFLGDNLEKDYMGPRDVYMESFLYDKNDRFDKELVKIKRIDELIERY